MNTTATASLSTERKSILITVVGNLMMASFGFSFAILTKSQAVLLDGAYSLAGFGLALLALRVSALVARPDDRRYPFGYVAYEPILNFSKGLLIGSISLLAILAAAISIFTGGRMIASGSALIYALIATTFCFLFAKILRHRLKKNRSTIVEVDRKNWIIDGVVSLGVAIAFLIAYLLPGLGFARWVPYVDPLITAIVCLAVLPATFRILQKNWHQMVARSATDDHVAMIEGIFEEDPALQSLGQREVRVLEVGRFLYVHIYLHTDEGSVRDFDLLRETIWKRLQQLFPHPALDMSFTSDEKWFRIATGDYSPLEKSLS